LYIIVKAAIPKIQWDATEVEGRWVIRGVWSGKFLMIRPARKEESVERKVAQRA
jgi:hypothetical protein